MSSNTFHYIRTAFKLNSLLQYGPRSTRLKSSAAADSGLTVHFLNTHPRGNNEGIHKVGSATHMWNSMTQREICTEMHETVLDELHDKYDKQITENEEIMKRREEEKGH